MGLRKHVLSIGVSQNKPSADHNLGERLNEKFGFGGLEPYGMSSDSYVDKGAASPLLATLT